MNPSPNIIIAQFCKWECEHGLPPTSLTCGCPLDIPDYENDLNAIHEAEKMLTDIPTKSGEKSQKTRYRENLCIECMGAGGPITASAQHRVNAFIKTINERSII